jgi:hypothetical protein
MPGETGFACEIFAFQNIEKWPTSIADVGHTF